MSRRVRLPLTSRSFFHKNSASSKRRGVRLDFCCLCVVCVTSFVFLATATFAGRARRDRANGAMTTLYEESETTRMQRAQSMRYAHASILSTPVQDACDVFQSEPTTAALPASRNASELAWRE